MHDAARNGDLLFADPAVRFGDVAHDFEGRREEQGLRVRRTKQPFAQRRRAEALIELMSQNRADERSDRATDHEAERAPRDFADPFHPSDP